MNYRERQRVRFKRYISINALQGEARRVQFHKYITVNIRKYAVVDQYIYIPERHISSRYKYRLQDSNQ